MHPASHVRDRTFRKVETFLWNDQRFRSLPDDVKLVWLHLLTTPAHDRFRCEGLVESTLHDVARYLGWVNGSVNAAVVDGLIRAQTAVYALADLGWVMVDRGVGLMLIPQSIKHNPPPNSNVVRHWLSALGHLPPSILRAYWVYYADAAVRRRYGREDARAKLLGGVRTRLQSHVKALEAATKSQATDVKGIYRGYTAHEDDHVDAALSGLRSEDPAQQEMAVVQQEETANKKNAKRRKDPPPPKPDDPPADFTPRERELWAAFRKESFSVPKTNGQTVWDNDRDPVQLCRQLAGDGFPSVDPPALIARLAAWTWTNKRNQRGPNLRHFLMNNFRIEQETGGRGSRFRGAAADVPRASAVRPLDERR